MSLIDRILSWCCPHRDEIVCRTKDRIYVQCQTCRRETPGWDIG